MCAYHRFSNTNDYSNFGYVKRDTVRLFCCCFFKTAFLGLVLAGSVDQSGPKLRNLLASYSEIGLPLSHEY